MISDMVFVVIALTFVLVSFFLAATTCNTASGAQILATTNKLVEMNTRCVTVCYSWAALALSSGQTLKRDVG